MTSYYVGAIDVHKSMLAVVLTDAAAEGEMVFMRRKFGALASDLRQLLAWLAEHAVREVVMGVRQGTRLASQAEARCTVSPPASPSGLSDHPTQRNGRGVMGFQRCATLAD